MGDRLNTDEAGKLLGVSRSRVIDLARSRDWNAVTGRGGRKLYLREDVEREREAREAGTRVPSWRTPAAATNAAKSAASERKCLRCAQPFPSWGAGNRLCEPCNAFARTVIP